MSLIRQVTTTQELRNLNQAKVLRSLYFHGPCNRQELSRLTDLSLATITNLTADLIETGIIVESGTEKSRGGRPSVCLTINRTFGYFIGIDLGETHIRFDLFDIKMCLSSTSTDWLLGGSIQPTEVVTKLVAGYRSLLAQAGLTEADVIGIGVGIPGVVEREGGISIIAPNWGWRNISLLSELEKEISVPILLDNGAKAMSLAEMSFGSSRIRENLITLLLGTGVGAGMIWNGLLLRGVTNSAGEWGHTTLDLDGRTCQCGGRGCLETYLGVAGIRQTLQEHFPDSPLLAVEHQVDFITSLVEADQQGDEAATFAVAETARYLGAGIANLINLYNPEAIILGGWVSKLLGERFLALLPAILSRYALHQPLAATKIKISQLGENAISLGAACLVLEEFLAGQRITWRLGTEFISLDGVG